MAIEPILVPLLWKVAIQAVSSFELAADFHEKKPMEVGAEHDISRACVNFLWVEDIFVSS